MISIVIVDSQTGFRDSITNLLSAQKDFDVIASGKDGFDALKLVEELKPDVAILELELPMLDAIKVSPSIRLRSPRTAVIVLTNAYNDETILQMISNGLAGYLLRSSVLDEISAAVRRVYGGVGYHMSPEASFRAIQLFSDFLNRTPCEVAAASAPAETIGPFFLNKIEMQIAAFIGDGMSNKQISQRLDLKEGTVRNYISTILQKTGLDHRTQIAIYAFKNGFAEQEEVKRQRGRRAASAPRNRSITNNFRLNPLQLELPLELAK
jgi:DNA-binding NarL/FixJ family response regulator